VKEVGSREFEKTQEEIQRTLKKASLGSSTSTYNAVVYIYNIILDLKSCLEIFTDPWDSKNIFTTCVYIDMS
jgi:hypothetical protein